MVTWINCNVCTGSSSRRRRDTKSSTTKSAARQAGDGLPTGASARGKTMTKEEYEVMWKVMGAIYLTLKWHRPEMDRQWHIGETERMYAAWRVWEHENADKPLSER